MADEQDPKAEASAEKAYAAAAQAAPNESEPDVKPVEPGEAEPVEPVQTETASPAIAQAEPVMFPAKAKHEPKAPPARLAPARPATAAIKLSKGRTSTASAKPARPAAPSRPAPAAKSKIVVKKAAPKAARPKGAAVPRTPAIPQFKEKQMDNPQAKQADKPADLAEGFQKIVTDTQEKAKNAFEKSTTLLGECTEFAKGNVEAIVESGKVLAAGLQDMGSSLVAESRSAVETMTGDVKQLAGAKSPTEFIKLQGDILRRNFDSAVALSSKNGEAVLKLASDSFAPISGRIRLAVEKLRKAA
jgi:hypothetical protein